MEKGAFKELFRPVSRKEYNSERKKAPPLSGKVPPKHVTTCTCPPCRQHRQRPRVEDSRMTFHGSIRLVQAVLETNQVYYTSNAEAATVLWTSKIMRPSTFQTLKKHQRINQFPRSSECTRKDNLSKNVSLMASKFPGFDFLSHGYIFPKERDVLRKAWDSMPNTPWIIKPASSACGRGVYITTEYDELPLEGLEEYVVERYINNPLLIQGFKFDLRLYVAVLSFEPLRIYLYKEGLVRFATHAYEKVEEHNKENKFMHLTNYSINKHNKDAFSTEPAHASEGNNSIPSKWHISKLMAHLKNDGKNTEALWKSIEDMVIKSFLSIEDKVVQACHRNVPHALNCFELFGFDVLIDEEMRPWLLEVNLSPSLACDADIDLDIKSNVLSDLFNLVHIRPQFIAQKKKNNTVSNYEKKSSLGSREEKIITALAKEDTGGFDRIFPRADSYRYTPFFETERPLNTVVIDAAFVEHQHGRNNSENQQSLKMEQQRARRRFQRSSLRNNH